LESHGIIDHFLDIKKLRIINLKYLILGITYLSFIPLNFLRGEVIQLNNDYKDTPSIDYIKEDVFKTEFEEEYNLKLNDKENKLFMRIFSDYKKRKLIQSICNVIVRIIK
jgi:hypothetical protein